MVVCQTGCLLDGWSTSQACAFVFRYMPNNACPCSICQGHTIPMALFTCGCGRRFIWIARYISCMSRSDFPLVLRRFSEIRLPLGCWFYFTESIAAFLLIGALRRQLRCFSISVHWRADHGNHFHGYVLYKAALCQQLLTSKSLCVGFYAVLAYH